MNPNWAIVAQLIIQEGLPLAEALVKKWQANPTGVPTDADWAELKALSLRTPESQMKDALARAGVDPNSDRAKELLALVQPTGIAGAPLAEAPPGGWPKVVGDPPEPETVTGSPEPIASAAPTEPESASPPPATGG